MLQALLFGMGMANDLLIDKFVECHMNWESFTTNPNNIQHAQISQLIQNQRIVVIIRQFVRIRFNTSHIPKFMEMFADQFNLD